MQGVVIGFGNEDPETKEAPFVRVRFASGVEKDVHRMTETVEMEGDSLLSMTRTQIPLKLAHAITIHKSQGQTLDRVVVRLLSCSRGCLSSSQRLTPSLACLAPFQVNARHCWEPGQVYVALSRATSLDGLEIEFINAKNPGLKANPRVLEFMAGSVLYILCPSCRSPACAEADDFLCLPLSRSFASAALHSTTSRR